MNKEQLLKACETELKHVKKHERDMQRRAMKSGATWKAVVGGSIPDKVYDGLQEAFAKAFGIIFDEGVGIIEKTYNKKELADDFFVDNFVVDTKMSARDLRKIREKAKSSEMVNSLITTVEGVGLGLLGIGIPDIVIFLGFIMKSVYETALKYGYEYETPRERYFILKLMSASLKKREKWIRADMEIDELISKGTQNLPVPAPDALAEQQDLTAEDFALDMLVTKFIQGLPIIGAVGGLCNPLYYKKILQYVQIKYYKRYLIDKMNYAKGITEEE